MKSLRLLLCVVLPAILGAGLLRAQNAEPQNTEITSDQFDWRSTDTETVAVFTGKVLAVSTNQRLTCDRLEIVATRKGDPGATIGKLDSFKSFLASGNVRIIQGDREAACGRAEVLPGQNKVVLTGQPVVVDHSVNWTWTGDELEMLRGERQVRGKNVRFTGPPIKDLGVDKDKKPEAAPAPEAPKAP
ncbi:MAG TPA: LptA/OstA family protein [Lacunisphaera sp.]|nr:LptA/OstA family protein [Lacunisphaera sp.]